VDTRHVTNVRLEQPSTLPGTGFSSCKGLMLHVQKRTLKTAGRLPSCNRDLGGGDDIFCRFKSVIRVPNEGTRIRPLIQRLVLYIIVACIFPKVSC